MTQATAAILDAVDARVEAMLPLIRAVQDGHRLEHGRFVQALDLSTETPADGGTEESDRRSLKPRDERYSWSEGIARYAPGHAIPALVGSKVRIHIYDGPLGEGWVLEYEHEIRAGSDDRGLWQRARHFGLETRRERGWRKVVPIGGAV